MKRLGLAALLCALPLSGFAKGELKPFQKEEKEEFDKKLDSVKSQFNTHCGAPMKMTVNVDFSGMDKKLWKDIAAHAYCISAAEGPSEVCRNKEQYRSAIVAKVKGVRCVWDGHPSNASGQFTDKNDLEFKQGILVYHMHPSHANVGETAYHLLIASMDE
jgi:hypothetical protein